jgi:deazaflavin-dependent oxidoreductase (nitroreductase family)
MEDEKDWNAGVIEEFRANEGKVSGQFEGAPMLLLTTTGAKTGLARTNPMMYLPDGDRWVVIASKAGADTHPDWFYNLSAHPEVTVEVGSEKFPAIATEVTGTERDELYAKQAGLYPGFAEYEQQTSRKIPVIRLARAG